MNTRAYEHMNTRTLEHFYFMVKMKQITIFLSIIFISHPFLFSQNNDLTPKYSNEFLAIGVGARALGMSNTQVAIVDDVTSGYWNPAGLMQINNNIQLMYLHTNYFAGIAKYDYGAVAVKINEPSRLGISVIRLGVDDIPNTLDLIDENGNIDYDRLSSFSIADYGFLFSYARKSPIEGLNYGGNLKVIYRSAGDFADAWGFGLDAGAQYFYKSWKFGAMARDVTSTFNAWSFNTETFEEIFIKTGNEIPENSLEIALPRLIVGASYTYKLFKSKYSLTPQQGKFAIIPEIDMDFTFDGMRNVLIKSDPISIDPHFGLELSYANFLYLRGGIGNIQEVTDIDGKKTKIIQPNMGIGIAIKNITIDYALTNIGDRAEGLYSNIFSIKFSVDKKAE